MNKTKQYELITINDDGEIETLTQKDENSIILTTVDSYGNVINKL